ncbi:hypothetical protein LZ30DRAFT_276282 [Colletotrichum cereale]|nr:hypothetical protein LZ30DRAFT_276282 [Colletotrichum cereale]
MRLLILLLTSFFNTLSLLTLHLLGSKTPESSTAKALREKSKLRWILVIEWLFLLLLRLMKVSRFGSITQAVRQD